MGHPDMDEKDNGRKGKESKRSGGDRPRRRPPNSETKSHAQSQRSRQRRNADSGSDSQVSRRLLPSTNLRDYVTLYVEYFEKGKFEAEIYFYKYDELLELAETFAVDDLDKRFEVILVLAAESPKNHLIQAVLVAGISSITKKTENALEYLVLWSFVEMAVLPDFQLIPYHQFVTLLASCELRLAHEFVVADAALLWLIGLPRRSSYAPAAFADIRSTFLRKVDRQSLIGRIATYQMPESLARFARASVGSYHSARICHEGTHISRRLFDCCIPDAENRPEETALSLSRRHKMIKCSDKNVDEPKRSESKRSLTMRSKKRIDSRHRTQKKGASNR